MRLRFIRQTPHTDPTRSAAAAVSVRRTQQELENLADPTAGRAAGTPWNAAQDPTRPAGLVEPDEGPVR